GSSYSHPSFISILPDTTNHERPRTAAYISKSRLDITDSVAVTTTVKEKTTPNFSPSPHLIGQQPFLTTSPPHFTHFYRQIIPFYLFSIYLYQLSLSHYTSDVF